MEYLVDGVCQGSSGGSFDLSHSFTYLVTSLRPWCVDGLHLPHKEALGLLGSPLPHVVSSVCRIKVGVSRCSPPS